MPRVPTAAAAEACFTIEKIVFQEVWLRRDSWWSANDAQKCPFFSWNMCINKIYENLYLYGS